MMGKDVGLGEFSTEQDAYRARASAPSHHASMIEHGADDAIALNARMDPSSEDVQFLDTKNGRLFGKDSDIKEFIRGILSTSLRVPSVNCVDLLSFTNFIQRRKTCDKP